MKRHIYAILSLAFIGVIASNAASAQAFEEYSGEETFFRFCASCHGEDGTGSGPVAAGLPITVPDLTTLQQRLGDRYREETLRKIIDGRSVVIYHGTRYMPVWGYEFWVEEGADKEAEARVELIISNLLDYMASIQR
ncbi:MAG: cytochrome c [Gammaproteobacteria bacterium]|nr:cytochrome c [Gammaproteobacteria bacterium]